MKKQILLLVILVLINGITKIYGQCGVNAGSDTTIFCGESVQMNAIPKWVSLNSGTTSALKSVFFTDVNTGYAVGDGGTILKTTDGGINWAVQTSSTTSSLTKVYFPNTNTGYVVGANEIILKTINGGINWTKQTSTISSPYYLRSVYFTDADTGYVVGDNGKILKTVDGGENWTNQTSGATTAIWSVFFTNSNTGYSVGSLATIFKTTDGGANWTKQSMPTNGGATSLRSVHFPSENIGYVVGSNGMIFKTTDGGINWSQQICAMPKPELYSVFFISDNSGYAAGNMGVLLRTIDGGVNWTRETNIITTSNSIYFSNNNGYNVGLQGKIGKLDQSGSYSWFPSTGLSSNNIAKPITSPQQTTNYIVTYTSLNGSSAKDTVTINLTSLSVEAGTNKTIICGGISQLDSVTTNYLGNGKLKYKWTPSVGLNNDTIANPTTNTTSDITYTVTVTTPNSCTSTDDIKVTVNSLSANAGVDKTIICGGTAQLNSVTTNYTGTGTLKYKWTPATGLNNDSIVNPTATVTSDITYTVTVTTPNGCTATDDIKVTVNSLSANAGTDKTIICGGTAQLNSVTTNYTGTGTLKYKWTPATGLNNDSIVNPTATVTSDITYTVTVTTPNGCTATDDIKVTVNSLSANAGADKTIICGGTAQLNSVTTNYTGTGTLKYKWTPATGLNNDSIVNPMATVTSDITYTVTVTTPNACTATDDIKVTVNSLTANAGVDKTIICGGTAQLNSVTSNYTGAGTLKYKWTPATGLNNDSIVNPMATVTSDITYTVTVTTPNACTATDDIKVTVNSLTANAGVDKTIICGGTAQLNSVTTNYTGAGTLKYKWTPATGLNNDSIINPTATLINDVVYTVTVKTPNGCTATDQVSVSIIPMSKPEIGMVGVSSNNKNLIAWNKPLSTGVESYYIYRETNVTNVYEKIGIVPYDSLSIYVDNQSLPDVQSNKYKLSILDRHGLESPQSNYHKTMHLAINKGMGNTWNLSWEAYEGFVVSTYNIYRGTTTTNLTLLGSTSGGNTQYNDLNAPTGDVYYQLEVISPNSVNPTKILTSQKTKAEENSLYNSLISYSSSRSNIATNVVSGINELGENNKINIYPNPVKNELRIDFEGGSTFEILNLIGQVVYNGNLIKNTIVQTSNLSSGIYLIKFKTGKSFEYKKIIKE